MKKQINEIQFEDTRAIVRNMLNYNHLRQAGEINTQPSMTVPDQAMSMKEILRRFAAGIPIEAGRVPIYDEENDLPDFRKMDLAEREAYVQQYNEELDAIARRYPKKTVPPLGGGGGAQEDAKPKGEQP